MNVPYRWLLSFFERDGQNALDDKLAESAQKSDLDVAAAKLEQLVGLLDGLGLSVERTFELPAVPEGVVVAEIISVLPVEGSDHLLLAKVETDSGQVQVVTGAPNTVVGLRTALARPGAVLPAVGLSVTEREMAGVRSEGVLCSPRELGVYDYGGGLIVFGDDAQVGAELKELWPAETVIELELIALLLLEPGKLEERLITVAAALPNEGDDSLLREFTDIAYACAFDDREILSKYRERDEGRVLFERLLTQEQTDEHHIVIDSHLGKSLSRLRELYLSGEKESQRKRLLERMHDVSSYLTDANLPTEKLRHYYAELKEINAMLAARDAERRTRVPVGYANRKRR